MRRPILALALVALLAGCATSPAPATSSVSSSSTTTTTPPTPAGNESGVAVTITATPSTIRVGQTATIVLTATNHGATPIWTNPSIVCTGSWDIEILNASGDRQRTDDRDSMGCASGGYLTTEVPPSASARVNYSWDGTLRPRLGAQADAPPGAYTVVGSVLWSAKANALNSENADTRRGFANATLALEAR